MKKLSITSLIMLTIVCPVFANVDIDADANSADCTNDILHTYSAPTSLEADWNANTIHLNWYLDSDATQPLSTGIQTSAQTCIYDGSITLPTTNPTKTGYTFDGWQVRVANPFADLDVFINSVNLSSDCGHGWYQNNDYCGISGQGPSFENCSGVKCSGIGLNEWRTDFSYGIVYGEASCNTTSYTGVQNGAAAQYLNNNLPILLNGGMSIEDFFAGFSVVATQSQVTLLMDVLARFQSGDISVEEAEGLLKISDIYVRDTLAANFDNTNTGVNCWCRATGLTSSSGFLQRAKNMEWAHQGTYDSVAECAAECAWMCADNMTFIPSFRYYIYNQ